MISSNSHLLPFALIPPHHINQTTTIHQFSPNSTRDNRIIRSSWYTMVGAGGRAAQFGRRHHRRRRRRLGDERRWRSEALARALQLSDCRRRGGACESGPLRRSPRPTNGGGVQSVRKHETKIDATMATTSVVVSDEVRLLLLAAVDRAMVMAGGGGRGGEKEMEQLKRMERLHSLLLLPRPPARPLAASVS